MLVTDPISSAKILFGTASLVGQNLIILSTSGRSLTMITLPNDNFILVKWASLFLMMVSAYRFWGPLAPFFVFGVWAFLNSLINTLCVYIASTGLMINTTLMVGLKKDESQAKNLHG